MDNWRERFSIFLKSVTAKLWLANTQGLINHWANRANARSHALLGASRLKIKILLYWFFVFLGCSPRVKNVEIFDYCV